MLKDSIDFFYFKTEQALYRDLVINEIYADNNPPNGIPDAEYIEVYNASNKVFNLENWEFHDASSSVVLDSLLLFPNEYFVLCSSTKLNLFSAGIKKMGVTGFPGLTNSGESISLEDPNGLEVDKVDYSISWYKDPSKDDGGWSLEQINPFTSCTGIANFQASNASIGGTPGLINSVFDTFTRPHCTTVVSS